MQLQACQPFSWTMSDGTCAPGQTIESSSAVEVTEKNKPRSAHSGTAAWAARRLIANDPGTRENLSARVKEVIFRVWTYWVRHVISDFRFQIEDLRLKISQYKPAHSLPPG